MTILKIRAVPYYLRDALKSNEISTADLFDMKRLSSIVSANCVEKYAFLNSGDWYDRRVGGITGYNANYTRPANVREFVMVNRPAPTAPRSDQICWAFEDRFNTHWMSWSLFWSNSIKGDLDDSPVRTCTNIIEALSPDGETSMASDIGAMMNTFALSFDFIKVDAKTYVILLDQLRPVQKVTDHLAITLKSMEALLVSLAEDLTDVELRNEPLYYFYTSLKAKLY